MRHGEPGHRVLVPLDNRDPTVGVVLAQAAVLEALPAAASDEVVQVRREFVVSHVCRPGVTAPRIAHDLVPDMQHALVSRIRAIVVNEDRVLTADAEKVLAEAARLIS